MFPLPYTIVAWRSLFAQGEMEQVWRGICRKCVEAYTSWPIQFYQPKRQRDVAVPQIFSVAFLQGLLGWSIKDFHLVKSDKFLGKIRMILGTKEGRMLRNVLLSLCVEAYHQHE